MSTQIDHQDDRRTVLERLRAGHPWETALAAALLLTLLWPFHSRLPQTNSPAASSCTVQIGKDQAIPGTCTVERNR
jgi:hypothetical protein